MLVASFWKSLCCYRSSSFFFSCNNPVLLLRRWVLYRWISSPHLQSSSKDAWLPSLPGDNFGSKVMDVLFVGFDVTLTVLVFFKIRITTWSWSCILYLSVFFWLFLVLCAVYDKKNKKEQLNWSYGELQTGK